MLFWKKEPAGKTAATGDGLAIRLSSQLCRSRTHQSGGLRLARGRCLRKGERKFSIDLTFEGEGQAQTLVVGDADLSALRDHVVRREALGVARVSQEQARILGVRRCDLGDLAPLDGVLLVDDWCGQRALLRRAGEKAYSAVVVTKRTVKSDAPRCP